MSDVVAAQISLQKAFPRTNERNVKGCLRDAHRVLTGSKYRLQLTHRRVRALWNGEVKRVDGKELDALRDAAGEGQNVKSEYQELTARIARLESLLEHQDADFHGPSIAAMRQGLRRGR